ncbi:transmembrane prolyl 4-hydroxylase-like [Haliotis cracherodii]|uniref:transmembrane prolyl 4-hydroxylase-like n=1 Tax=Haliotis cracherodii TaxID=6455 RepID=UPI0039ECC9C1
MMSSTLPLTWVMLYMSSAHVQGNATVNTCEKHVQYSFLFRQCKLPTTRDYALPWIVPGKTGSEVRIQLHPGITHWRRTLAQDPPVFEIPGFLTAKECSLIISQARSRGLRGARQMGAQEARTSNEASGRVAQTAFVSGGRHLLSIRHRISALTGIPLDLVLESEPVQVVMYTDGGYYHSHYDSSGDGGAGKPCCHQTWFPHTKHRCVLCRYLTVLVYLNDVEEGGETAFPVADQDHDFKISKEHTNLTEHCHRAPVAVTPEMGKAVMWYNHHMDEKTGWMGSLHRRSLHGGCNVKHGEKWIANFWINAARYVDKDKHSIYTERWE